MKKNIIILGSTGSIGRNTLKIIEQFKDRFNIIGLSANNNFELLEKQINQFNPPFAAITNSIHAKHLQENCKEVKILDGEQGIKELCRVKECDMVLNAIIGSSGLKYTIEAILHKKDIALANKESYVMAGTIINDLVKKYDVNIIPVDSEHSAIFHLMANRHPGEIEKIYLTASGGPFLKTPVTELENISVRKTLNHPVWNMGGKITVDSATMMNKGFELIEAHHLFNFPYDKIEVIIHPQSIIHSMIKTVDGEIYAQLSPPDMKFPIMNAISYPEKLNSPFEQLNLFGLDKLTFEKPDLNKFPLLPYSYEIGKKGGNGPAALCIADDIAVNKFLENKIKFTDIFPLIKNIVKSVKYVENPNLGIILSLEKELVSKQF